MLKAVCQEIMSFLNLKNEWFIDKISETGVWHFSCRIINVFEKLFFHQKQINYGSSS